MSAPRRRGAVRRPTASPLTGLEEPVLRRWGPARTAASHLVALVAVLASAIYLTWRATSTIGWGAWWIAVPLFALEAHLFIRMTMTLVEIWDLDRSPAVEPVDETNARVAVLIATYNEGVETLLPTIAASVALAPEHETWVLDDGRRPEVAALADALGAKYLTRSDNRHAKAGNLNHALKVVDADFIAVLDADHVPERDFLRHTLGYFDDPAVAVVQAPQEFYNGDSFIHTGRLGHHDEQFFHRVVMSGRSRFNSAIWCGTNAVLRTEAIRWVGGVSTETITEDMHTTYRLHRTGWRTIHHNEVLARGLAPRSYAEFRTQRWRWGAGSMQSLAVENPMLSGGLTGRQRFMYGSAALGWFDSWRTLLMHLIAPLVLLTGAAPVSADTSQLVLALFAVHSIWLVTMAVFGRGRLGLVSTLVFELLKMPPNLRSSLIWLRPRALRFGVTPKGRTASTRSRSDVPGVLWVLLALDLVAWAWATGSLAGFTFHQPPRPALTVAAVGWLLANTVVLVLAIDRIRRPAFSAERRDGLRFAVDAPVLVDGRPSRLEDLSLSGASMTQSPDHHAVVGSMIRVEVMVQHRRVRLTAKVTQSTRHRFGVEFDDGQWNACSALAAGLFRGGLGVGELVADHQQVSPGWAELVPR